MLKAVVFDLDGTLLDTIDDIAGALNRALASCGLPVHPVEACRGFVGGGIREAVCRAVPDREDRETVERVLAAYLADYFLHCAEKTVRYPGIPDLLSALEARGVALGVLSNKTEATARRIISAYFPHVPFRCVFGRTEGRPLKPDPAAAGPVLEALALPAASVAYVGDSGTDMVFARRTGLFPAAAAWGYRSRRELEESGAAVAAGTPAELLAALEEKSLL